MNGFSVVDKKQDKVDSSSKCFIPTKKIKETCCSKHFEINTNPPIKIAEAERTSNKNQDRTNMSSEESSVIFQENSDFSSYHGDKKINSSPITSKTDNFMSKNTAVFLSENQFLDKHNQFNDELQKYSDLCSSYFIENFQYSSEKNKMKNNDKFKESLEKPEFEPGNIENWEKRTDSNHQETINKNNVIEIIHQQEDIFHSLTKNGNFIASNSPKHISKDSNYNTEHKHASKSHCNKKQNSQICIHNHDAHFLYRRPIPPLNLRYDLYESTYRIPYTYLNPTLRPPHMFGSNITVPNVPIRNSNYSRPIVQYFENKNVLTNQSRPNKSQDIQEKMIHIQYQPNKTNRHRNSIETIPQKLSTVEKENTIIKQKYSDFYSTNSPLEKGLSIHRSHSISKKKCTTTDILSRNPQKLCYYNNSVDAQNSHTCKQKIFPQVTADHYFNHRSPYFASDDFLSHPYFTKQVIYPK